jgi:hypothetical protein
VFRPWLKRLLQAFTFQHHPHPVSRPSSDINVLSLNLMKNLHWISSFCSLSVSKKSQNLRHHVGQTRPLQAPLIPHSRKPLKLATVSFTAHH